jgi:hypothetical protein
MTREDPEVAAIKQMNDALAPLDEGTRNRVIEWAAKRYGSAVASFAAGQRASAYVAERRDVPTTAAPNTESAFEAFGDLYTAVDPQTDADKALVGGYWLQVCTGQTTFASGNVNELLKDHGRPVGNITRAFDALRAARPALVNQTEKSGKTKQARKKYKLTTEGQKWIRGRLNGGGGHG